METDDDGLINYIFSPPATTGVNIVMASISKLSLMDTFLVYSTGDEAYNVSVHPYDGLTPSDSVLADGRHNHRILAQVVDRFGNGIGAGTPVTIADQYGDTVVVYTSDQGWVNAFSMPSVFPGSVSYNASFVNRSGIQNVPFTLYYTTAAPSVMTLNAYPKSVASGEVMNQHLGYDINTSQIVAFIADSYNHPLTREQVTMSIVSANGSFYDRTNNTYVQTITNYTDENGQYIVALNVSPNAYFNGVINIDAISNNTVWVTSLRQSTTVAYTDQSHLNVTTSVDKHVVQLNDTLNVTVSVDGIGWQEGRPPIDLMLVLDKSGSMGDAMNNVGGNFVYDPANGGWFAPTVYAGDQNVVPTNNTYVRVGSFNHTGSTRMVVDMKQVNPAPTPIPMPRANFTGSPLTINSGGQVTFTDSSTGFPDVWTWDFGDGNTSNVTNPTIAKTYYTTTSSKKYTVNLTVSNGAGTDTKTMIDYITVNMRAPVANFGATNNTGIWPRNVSFTDSSTGDAPLSYQWSFGDGSPNGTTKNPYHVYNNPGTYNVILTVTNPAGSSSLARNGLVQISNPSAPVVAWSANATNGYRPMMVKFTSTSTGAGVLTYNWTFGDGNTSTLQIPTNIYNVTGTYTVALTVTSNYSGYVTTNSLTRSNWISVSNPTRPTANFSANQTYGEWPLAVAFQDLSTGTPAPTYLWDFGDGTTDTTKNPVHVYNSAKVVYGAPKSYTVTLTVTNLAGSDTMVKTNHITIVDPVSPLADFVANVTTGMKPLCVAFTDLSTGSPQTGKTTMDYVWNFGDGTPTSTSRNVTHIYNNAGTYTVSLKATNVRGSNTNTKTGYIIVTAPTPTPSPGPTVTPTPTPVPAANFYGTPLTGVKPLSVQFTDQSSNTPTSWLWNFGDLTPASTAQNPVHVYTNVGTYSVTLTATNGGGSSAPYTRTNYIVVTNPIAPHADFMSDYTEGIRPFTINFQDMSSGSGVFTYLWNFGDGTTSTVRNASHTYTTTGTYPVSLTINSVTYPGTSDQMVKSNYITIKDPYPPVADFTYSQPRNYWPVTVTFTDQTGGTPPFTYDWDFGDGVTMHAISGQTVVTHTYTHAGTFSVTLTSHNEMGDNTSVKSNAITVYDPVMPTASFYADTTTGPKTLHVNFIASASTGTPPLTYTWDFGEGSPVTTASPTISHDYASVGTYNVRLNVSNEWGYNLQTKNGYIVVNYPAPVANFNPASASGKVPYTVSFTDTSTNPISWSWDFGDGTTDTSSNPTHTYTTPGRYSVSLTATNPSGSNTKPVANCVIVSPAAAFTGTPTSGSRPLVVQFTDSSAGSPTAWLWNFGDGATDTTQNPVHSYSSTGTYTVTLTVTANGVSDTLTKSNYITVNSVVPHGMSLPSDDTYMFQIRGPNGTIIGNFSAGQQKILFGGLASTDDGSIIATAATPGTYEIWAKRTYTQGPMYRYDVQVYDQMKLGQSVDNDSAAKMGSRELINSLWVNDRAGLVTFSDEGYLDAPLDYLNGTPRSNLINSINGTNSFGWTDMRGGMYLARQQFESHPNSRQDVQKIEVLLTDGYPTNSSNQGITPEEKNVWKEVCQQEAILAKADGIKIYTIGIGTDPSAVDGPFLQNIADMTNGTYQFCSNYQQIWDAFKNIGAQLEQNISTTSDLNIVPERTQIYGTWFNNTTLIPGTGKTWTDGNTSNPGSYSQQPNIFLNGNMYNLTWNIDPIKLSHTWTLTYQVKAEKVGYTHPVSNLSYAAIHKYNSTDIIPVSIESDMVYVSSNLTDNMTDMDMLSIHISMPYEGYPITQPSQDLLWTVNYHGIATYTTIKEYAPYGTLNWKPIGGVHESNQTHTFSDVWNLGSQVTPGKYTLIIRASDGWFNATGILNFTVQYVPGQINVVDRP